MSKFFSKRFKSLTAYVPGEQPKDYQYVKLNTNENPYPPCPEAIEAIDRHELSRLKLYSDPDCTALLSAVCEKYGVGRENVIFSNGSDEILSFAFMAYCDKKTSAAFPNISYGFYKVFGDLYNIDYSEIPLKNDFTINVSDYCSISKTIFIANPNAPTGLSLTSSDIEMILKTNRNNIVVIDEAYIDFGGKTCYNLINKYDNLLVVQTFSKSRSLAGARLGFGIASAQIIKDLNTIKFSTNPYNINSLTQRLGQVSMKNIEYFNECCNKIIRTREYTKSELKKRGFIQTASTANFLFAKHPTLGGEYMYQELKRRGILVRHFNKPEIEDYLRITIGTDEEMNKLLDAIDDIK